MNIYSKIKNEYDRRQKIAYENLEDRKNTVFPIIPRLKEIESEIHLSGVKYNKMILLGISSSDKVLDELSKKIDALKIERESLLTRHGFPPDYLSMTYQCDECKDTGFIDRDNGSRSEKCRCYRQQLINLLYKQSNMLLSDTENFSYFDETYYDDKADELKYGIRKSPRENILGIKDKCLKFIDSFSSSDEKNLFFCGPAGVGKTFMANCIAREILDRGWTVLYQTAPGLFDIIADYKMRSFKDEDFDDTGYRNIFQADLLIIDDLGTETPTTSRYAELLNILNTRQASNIARPCKMIISTNIEADMLYEYYTERVASRIIGGFALFKFAGEDIRKLKRQKPH